MTYAAPLADMRLTLAAVAGVEGEDAELAATDPRRGGEIRRRPSSRR